MTELMIPLPEPQRPTISRDTEPTPLEIQRWEDDGGAALTDERRPRQSHCYCGDDNRERAAA
jgi:hypothetical protein